MPATLSARIACVLVGGLVLSQLLTGTIWFESRRRQMLEIPARVFATRVADSLRLLEASPPEARQRLLSSMATPEFQLALAHRLPARTENAEDIPRSAAILAQSLRHQSGPAAEIHVLSAQLLDERNLPAGRWAMLRDRKPAAAFTIAARLQPDAPWLVAHGREDQDGASFDPADTIADYVLRIYFLRMLMVAGLTWIAVRLAMKPLERLALAAQRLGRDIRSPALEIAGPVEVRRAIEAFNGMQRQLTGYLDERTRLLAAVSHDLRSPITRLRLRTELLPSAEDKGPWRRDLDAMESMVDATLSFMQGGAAEGVREPVDLDAILLAIRGDLRTQGGHVELHGTCGPPLTGFPLGLRRCLENLVGNAIRYGQCARIYAEDLGGHVVIRIRDDGPGIPEGHLQLVFEPFYREEMSRNSALGGFGLGLSIARDIALAHDGTLTLRNHPEGGLEAILHLPRA